LVVFLSFSCGRPLNGGGFALVSSNWKPPGPHKNFLKQFEKTT